MNLKSMLQKTADKYAGKMAIVYGDRRISYSELDEASNKIASTLIEFGVNKGDRVAMMLSNSPEFVITYFGIVKIGALAVPLEPKYRVNELTHIFDNALPKVLVVESAVLESLITVLSKFRSIRHVINTGSEFEDRFISFRQIMTTGSGQRFETDLSPDDIAIIMYASASSFHPKGVMLSHRSFVMEAAMSAAGYQQTDEDIMMLYALPLYHVYGLVAALLASIYTGGTVVIVPGTGLSINNFMEAVENEKGTMFLGVPYIFALAADMAEKDGIKSDLSSLRLCASAGAPLSVDTIRRFKQYYGFTVFDCWGLTEAVCHITCPSLNGSVKSGSVGKPLSKWEVKIVDGTGMEQLPNQAGELLVRGPIMRGYYNNPQATDEAIKDGWLYTGDIGKADRDGNLYVTGRKKDIIIVKGQNINPVDIETVISTHPKVAEVAVIGIPDKLRGEIIGAVVSLRRGTEATEHEIKQYCLERMVSFKAPKQVIFVESLPRNAVGEVDKESIRNLLSIPALFPEIDVS
jgi:long-chain acyl-CoA synthetase